MHDSTELWPFDSSSSSTNSARNRTAHPANIGKERKKTYSESCELVENSALLLGNDGNGEPITYSAFGVTISTFKDPSENSPKPSCKKKKVHRHRRSNRNSNHLDNVTEDGELQVDFFEDDESTMPLLIGRRQRSNTENSYGSSRLSFLSRDSESINNLRGDGTSFYEESLNRSEFCASLFLPSLSFQSSFSRGRHFFSESKDSSSSVLETLVERLYPDRTGTVMLASWNILPLLAGSGVFSMPFAVSSGGYFALIFMVVMSLMSDITGLILIDCLYEVSPNSKQRKRVRRDLADIARAVCGRVGSFIVHSFLVMYLFLGNVVNILLLAKSVFSMLHTTTKLSFVALTCLFSLLAYPTLLIRRLSILAYISLLSVISIMIGIVALIVIFIREEPKWAHNSKDIPFLNVTNFPLSIGIIMFSCVSHSVLPQVEGNMINSKDISKVIHTSYISSTVIKVCVGFLGVLAFGMKTESLITLNASRINQVAKTVLGVSATGYAILNYPLNMFIVCETIDKVIIGTFIEKTKKFMYTWVAFTRLFLFIMTVVVALVAPYFGILLALRGSLIGTCLIFIFPCYFHLRLKWKKLGCFQKFIDVLLLTIGAFLGVVSLYSAINSLIVAIKTGVE